MSFSFADKDMDFAKCKEKDNKTRDLSCEGKKNELVEQLHLEVQDAALLGDAAIDHDDILDEDVLLAEHKRKKKRMEHFGETVNTAATSNPVNKTANEKKRHKSFEMFGLYNKPTFASTAKKVKIEETQMEDPKCDLNKYVPQPSAIVVATPEHVRANIFKKTRPVFSWVTKTNSIKRTSRKKTRRKKKITIPHENESASNKTEPKQNESPEADLSTLRQKLKDWLEQKGQNICNFKYLNSFVKIPITETTEYKCNETLGQCEHGTTFEEDGDLEGEWEDEECEDEEWEDEEWEDVECYEEFDGVKVKVTPTPATFNPIEMEEGCLNDLCKLIVDLKYPHDCAEEWLEVIERKFVGCTSCIEYYSCLMALKKSRDETNSGIGHSSDKKSKLNSFDELNKINKILMSNAALAYARARETSRLDAATPSKSATDKSPETDPEVSMN